MAYGADDARNGWTYSIKKLWAAVTAISPAAPAAAVADIPDTSTATAEEVGDKVNELLASLRAAGFLDT